MKGHAGRKGSPKAPETVSNPRATTSRRRTPFGEVPERFLNGVGCLLVKDVLVVPHIVSGKAFSGTEKFGGVEQSVPATEDMNNHWSNFTTQELSPRPR
jgi:hypothetical protein